MPESETGTPTAASVPATPDTPGGPLFTSLRVDSLSHERNSFTMNRCKCFPTKDQSCFTDFSLGVSLPNVSLTQKVIPIEPLSLSPFLSTLRVAILSHFLFFSVGDFLHLHLFFFTVYKIQITNSEEKY